MVRLSLSFSWELNDVRSVLCGNKKSSLPSIYPSAYGAHMHTLCICRSQLDTALNVASNSVFSYAAGRKTKANENQAINIHYCTSLNGINSSMIQLVDFCGFFSFFCFWKPCIPELLLESVETEMEICANGK